MTCRSSMRAPMRCSGSRQRIVISITMCPATNLKINTAINRWKRRATDLISNSGFSRKNSPLTKIGEIRRLALNNRNLRKSNRSKRLNLR